MTFHTPPCEMPDKQRGNQVTLSPHDQLNRYMKWAASDAHALEHIILAVSEATGTDSLSETKITMEMRFAHFDSWGTQVCKNFEALVVNATKVCDNAPKLSEDVLVFLGIPVPKTLPAVA